MVLDVRISLVVGLFSWLLGVLVAFLEVKHDSKA